MGQRALAMTDYNEAIRLDPNLGSAYLDRGNLYLSAADYARAFYDFDRAISFVDSNELLADAYYGRGVSQRQLGKRVKASEDFRKALQLNPKHDRARKELDVPAAR